jgi:hypothetical protein
MQTSDEAMNCIGNLNKKFYVSIAKLKNFVIFAFTYMAEVLLCLMEFSA